MNIDTALGINLIGLSELMKDNAVYIEESLKTADDLVTFQTIQFKVFEMTKIYEKILKELDIIGEMLI